MLLHSGLSGEDVRRIGEGAPFVLLVLLVVFLFFPFDPVAALQEVAGVLGVSFFLSSAS